MSVRDLPREELELFSYKDLTNLLLEEKNLQTTVDLFKTIAELLGLSDSEYESKIGDYYMTLTTDKRFIMLEDGKWDLRSNHTSDKVVTLNHIDDDDEENIDEIEKDDVDDPAVDEEETNDFDSNVEDDYDDDSDDDLKDLVIIDDEELELEE